MTACMYLFLYTDLGEGDEQLPWLNGKCLGGRGDKRDSALKPQPRAVRYTNKFDLGTFTVWPKDFERTLGNPPVSNKASTEEPAFPTTFCPCSPQPREGA